MASAGRFIYRTQLVKQNYETHFTLDIVIPNEVRNLLSSSKVRVGRAFCAPLLPQQEAEGAPPSFALFAK